MNRSEELCKLLGLKTETRWRGALGLHLWEHKIIDDNGNETEKVEIYPDLTKPSNFVKLLEDIKVDGIYLGDWLVTYYGYFTNRDSYIENLVSTLKDERKYYLKNDIQQIKQQAQATKWDY